MRKIFFICFLLFFSLSLFALDPYVEKQIDKGVELALSGLHECDYKILSYEEKQLDKAVISITLELDNKPYYIVVKDKSLKKARKNIDKEVKKALKYITWPHGDELTLDYEFDTSFSSLTPERLRNGSTFLAKGVDGKNYGLLTARTEKGISGVTTYDVLYNKGLKPGLKLEKTGGNLLSFSFGLSPYKVRNALSYNFSLDYKNITLLYPFSPTLGFSVSTMGNVWHYLFTLGFDYYLPLSTFFTSSFTMLQDGGVSAGLSLVLGTEGRDFIFGTQFDLFYSWYLSHNFFISFGFNNQVLSSALNGYKLYSMTNYIALKGGIRF